MKKKIIVFSLCSLCFVFVWGQHSKKKTYSFHSINCLGLANGSTGFSPAMQTVNGFLSGPWFAGIGLGLDYYQYRTVPFFADVRYEYGKKNNKVFAYADAGINFSWTQDNLKYVSTIWNGNRSNNFNNGFYTDAGIGLTSLIKNGNALILSLGISRKTLEEKISYDDWRSNKPQTDIYTYRLNRVILKTGFRF